MAELAARILADLAARGRPVGVEALAPYDELHAMGKAGTDGLAALAEVTAADRVVDLGCGTGGPARRLAARFGARVHGIDRHRGWIAAARHLTVACGLQDRVSLAVGNVCDTDGTKAGRFTLVWTQHVGMAVADKRAFFATARRLVAPGGRLALFDVLRTGADSPDPAFPVPWADRAADSHLIDAETLTRGLATAGFRVRLWQDVGAEALARIEAALARPGLVTADDGPALTVGPDWPERARNLRDGMAAGHLTLVRLVADPV